VSKNMRDQEEIDLCGGPLKRLSKVTCKIYYTNFHIFFGRAKLKCCLVLHSIGECDLIQSLKAAL